MNKWEYNTIDQRNYIESRETNKPREDIINEMLNSFGKNGWELVGWFERWFIFKRKLETPAPYEGKE